MPNNTDAWLARARALLSRQNNASEEIHFATSLVTALYGAHSSQLNALTNGLAQMAKAAPNPHSASIYQSDYARGTIQSAVAELEGGLVGAIRAQVAGEVFGELVGLGKEILEDQTESAKNVSAVLIAAAFEDLMRRMGTELAGVAGRPKLEEVVIRLKEADVLKGGEIGTAQSYLKFRNDSLHANWANVHESQVRSCTAFIESLLLKHFS